MEENTSDISSAEFVSDWLCTIHRMLDNFCEHTVFKHFRGFPYCVNIWSRVGFWSFDHCKHCILIVSISQSTSILTRAGMMRTTAFSPVSLAIRCSLVSPAGATPEPEWDPFVADDAKAAARSFCTCVRLYFNPEQAMSWSCMRRRSVSVLARAFSSTRSSWITEYFSDRAERLAIKGEPRQFSSFRRQEKFVIFAFPFQFCRGCPVILPSCLPLQPY